MTGSERENKASTDGAVALAERVWNAASRINRTKTNKRTKHREDGVLYKL